MAAADVQTNLRLPALLKRELQQAAACSGRSMTAEIVYRLRGGVADPGGIELTASPQCMPTTFFIDEAEQDDGSVLTVRREGELPFVPIAGAFIACGENDDFRKVSCVQYHAGERRLYVTFEYEKTSLAMLLRQGWRVDGQGTEGPR